MPIPWVIGISAGILGIVVAASRCCPSSTVPKRRTRGKRLVLTTEPEERLESGVALEKLINLQPKAERIFKDYMSAAAADDILPLVRDPHDVAPLIRASAGKPVLPRNWKISREPLGCHFQRRQDLTEHS